MKKSFSRLALTLVTVGSISASMLACSKHPEDNIPKVEDSVLAANITAALVADPKFKDAGIKVDAHEGEVVLNGVLDSFPLIDQAVEIASKVVGVKHVSEKLTKRDAGADAK